MIAGYLGDDDTFDRAHRRFAVAYADQNDADYAAFTTRRRRAGASPSSVACNESGSGSRQRLLLAVHDDAVDDVHAQGEDASDHHG